MNKEVFCKNCRHYSMWETHNCSKPKSTEKTPFEIRTIFCNPYEENADNNCKYFEPKPKEKKDFWGRFFE